MISDLEPLRGTYDWDQAFAQNPGEPEYAVSEEQRRKAHDQPDLTSMPAGRPDYPVASSPVDLVAQAGAFLAAMVLSALGVVVVIEKRIRRALVTR